MRGYHTSEMHPCGQTISTSSRREEDEVVAMEPAWTAQASAGPHGAHCGTIDGSGIGEVGWDFDKGCSPGYQYDEEDNRRSQSKGAHLKILITTENRSPFSLTFLLGLSWDGNPGEVGHAGSSPPQRGIHGDGRCCHQSQKGRTERGTRC